MNENFKFYIWVHYGMHHVLVETTHEGFTKYIDDMSQEFSICKEFRRNKLKVWIYNYVGDREDLGYIEEWS